ncbi:MAG: Hsp20/alpha crystallin family protein [Deltaproteobacteria bacterium]|nr:MAG: Hsp20/alpha crystallin family protein [Deltaproteobacteria bacterium]
MTLVRWSPFEEMDKVFRRLGDNSFKKLGFDLAVDVYEDNDQVIAEMHIAGIDPKKIDVEVDGELLKISGMREVKKEYEHKNYFHREIVYGDFERIIALPKKVLSEGTKASYSNGVLKVNMPIENILKKKKITVN